MSCLMTKPTKGHVRQVKTQIRLGIRPVWSESLLSAWRNIGSLATHWAHSEASDLSLRWVHSHFIVFVMWQLKWAMSWKKSCLCHRRTTKAQISLHIPAVSLVPLLFTAYSLCNIFLKEVFFAHHHAMKYPHTSIILSWFSIPLVLKCAAKILKIGLQIKIQCPKTFLDRNFA